MSHSRILLCSFILSLLFSSLKADESLNNVGIANSTEDLCQQKYCESRSDENSTTNNEVDLNTMLRTSDFTTSTHINTEELWQTSNLNCPTNLECNQLPADCIHCKFNFTCIYGETLNVSCQALSKCEVL